MNEKLMKSGSGLIGVLEKTRVALDPLSRRLLGRTVADEGSQPAGLADFEREAEELMSRQRTARAQRIVRSAVVVVCGLIVWAAFAEIDEVTKGDGRVIPSRQLQVVQSLDGGVVSEILVREGQQVEAGQLLLKIDETRATSGVNESAAQAFALQVKQARLKALAEGIAFRPPAGSGSPDENRIVDEERNLYQSKVYELESM
nr:biotin/lipoyl-binding protein [Sphaerotilus sp.]